MAAASTNRQARGRAREERILRATLELIEREGVGAVTHRAVARRAGLPVGSLAHYFPAKQDLLRAALLAFVQGQVERVEAARAAVGDGAGPSRDVAARAIAALGEGVEFPAAQFELYLECRRDPALRDAARACLDAYERLAAVTLGAAGIAEPERWAAVFVAAADGLALQQLVVPAERGARRGPGLAALFALVAGAAQEQPST